MSKETITGITESKLQALRSRASRYKEADLAKLEKQQSKLQDNPTLHLFYFTAYMDNCAQTKLPVGITDYQNFKNKLFIDNIDKPIKTETSDLILKNSKEKLKSINNEKSVPCRYCKCNTSITFTMTQSRSADEPMTTTYECSNCNKGWKE